MRDGRLMRRDDAVRFLHATLEVLRGADDGCGEASFGNTLEWLWNRTNRTIAQLFCSDALTLHALRLPPFGRELKHRTGGRLADDDDLDALRCQLMTTIEAALAEGLGPDRNGGPAAFKSGPVARHRAT